MVWFGLGLALCSLVLLRVALVWLFVACFDYVCWYCWLVIFSVV